MARDCLGLWDMLGCKLSTPQTVRHAEDPLHAPLGANRNTDEGGGTPGPKEVGASFRNDSRDSLAEVHANGGHDRRIYSHRGSH
ncbi:MAG: hypothetical protein PVSMB7_01800 [Chloroflexota bacterium]